MGENCAKYGALKSMVMDMKNYDEQDETLMLLKILALGNCEIEDGKFRAAEDVFAELDDADDY